MNKEMNSEMNNDLNIENEVGQEKLEPTAGKKKIKREQIMTPAKRVAVVAVFVALMAAMFWVPYCFLIVVLVASIWLDKYNALILSIFVGVISYLYALLGGSLISPFLVQYPYVTIIARMFIGPVTHFSYRGIKKLCQKNKSFFMREAFPASIAAGIGSLTNSVLVLGSLALIAWLDTSMALLLPNGTNIWMYLLGLLMLNVPVELGINMIAVPAIHTAGQKALMHSSLRIGR